MILITFSYNARYEVGSNTTSCWESFHETFRSMAECLAKFYFETFCQHFVGRDNFGTLRQLGISTANHV